MATKEINEKVIFELLPQIEKIARGVYHQLPEGSVELQDLVNEAVVGILKAIKRLKKDSFNPDGSLKNYAKSYLLKRAKGAIFDYLRSLDFGSKRLREKEKHLKETIERLRRKLKREPTEEEIAQELQISVDELRKLFEEISFSYILSLEEIFQNNPVSENFEDFIASKGWEIEKQIERKELIQRLKEALNKLSQKELLVLQLYFFESLKTEEIAHILELTPGRITQLKKSALKKLYEEMKKYL